LEYGRVVDGQGSRDAQVRVVGGVKEIAMPLPRNVRKLDKSEAAKVLRSCGGAPFESKADVMQALVELQSPAVLEVARRLGVTPASVWADGLDTLE
jgi:hypothetical protein